MKPLSHVKPTDHAVMTKPKWPSLAYWLAYLVTLLPGLLVLGIYALQSGIWNDPESKIDPS